VHTPEPLTGEVGTPAHLTHVVPHSCTKKGTNFNNHVQYFPAQAFPNPPLSTAYADTALDNDNFGVYLSRIVQSCRGLYSFLSLDAAH